MAAFRGQLWTRLTQISHRSLRIRQPVKNISSATGEQERSLLRRIISDWKTPSLVFISGVLGCLFYERFIEEPDETGTRDPLITRLMMKYIMADPEQDTLTRDNHLRRVREKCDVYLEMRRKPKFGKQPFDIEHIESYVPKYENLGQITND
ncbi:hypothetical protein OS493_000515 [Desmophyllum pertusum]|uniref:Uncharacterized protein n=1 Tax=Desmophyllum pertusum TaxID=174260 RepID=A0A9X0A7G2_9CNID|nr:hypothetical protein OS493_000515 [Desmophyllum pertusum]